MLVRPVMKRLFFPCKTKGKNARFSRAPHDYRYRYAHHNGKGRHHPLPQIIEFNRRYKKRISSRLQISLIPTNHYPISSRNTRCPFWSALDWRDGYTPPGTKLPNLIPTNHSPIFSRNTRFPLWIGLDLHDGYTSSPRYYCSRCSGTDDTNNTRKFHLAGGIK